MLLRPKLMMLVSGLVLLSAFWVRAEVGDFETKDEIDVQGQPAALAVSLDDRFVFAAEKDNDRLVIIDTWNWRVVNPLDSNTIGEEPVDMAVSPTGKYIYISRTDGIVSQFDISGLSDLDFNADLSPVTEWGFTVSDSNTLGDIAVIPQQNDTNVDCVFVVDETAGDLHWFMIQETEVILQDIIPPITGGSDLELAAGRDVVFAKFMNIGGLNQIFAFQCLSSQIAIYNDINDYGTDTLQGIAADPTGARLAIGDRTTNQLLHFDASIITNILKTDFLGITISPEKVLYSSFSHEQNSLIWATGNHKLLGASLDGDSLFTGDTVSIDFSDTVTGLAQSSTVDGYIYSSMQGSDTVFIVTANPWVSDVQAIPGGTIGGDTVTVKFSYDKGNSYTIRRVEGFKEGGTELESGNLSGSPASVNISTYKLKEGRNILAVEVTDADGRTGRNAIEVQVDLPPPALDFDLDFGDEKLIISFRAHDLPDLDYYEIYYGTNGSVPENEYEKIDDTGKMGNPGSPFRISGPEPKKKYEKVITGLENGKRYYVQIITADKTPGHISISARKSAVVQPVGTLTDLAGEEGGFDCFESLGPSEGALSFIWLLILPILFAGMLRLLLRMKKS